MDFFQGLLLITSIHLLAAMSPGPDFILVSQQTLSKGKKAGLLCSIGIALGLSIHILYSSLGLAVVIANSTYALIAIKIIGGCYLVYLGIKGLRAKANTATASTSHVDNSPNQTTTYSPAKTIATGFFCNALNPKAPIYFVSLFTLVMSPDIPLYQMFIYGVWIMILQWVWFSALTYFISMPIIMDKFKRFGHWIDRCLGGMMVALGLKVLVSRVN